MCQDEARSYRIRSESLDDINSSTTYIYKLTNVRLRNSMTGKSSPERATPCRLHLGEVTSPVRPCRGLPHLNTSRQ